MRVRDLVPFVISLLLAAPTAAQTTDPVAGLLLRLEQTLTEGTAASLGPLLHANAERSQIEAVVSELQSPSLVRVTIKERDRQVLADGGGLRLLVDVLAETASQARVATWRLDVADPAPEVLGTVDGYHRIRTMARLSMLDALFRLTLSQQQYQVRDLRITGEDLEVTVPSGSAWVAEVNGLPTAMVIFGEAEMAFTPKPLSEQGQLEIFAGERSLRGRVNRLFIRLNPADMDVRLNPDGLRPAPLDRQGWSRARNFFDEYMAKSFSLDLQDLSSETWSLVPPIGDLLVELDTARFGQLTYSRSGGESEDVSVFDRRRRKNISVYSSARQLAVRGTRNYDEAQQLDYLVEHYAVDVSYDPARAWFEGRADLDVVIQSHMATTLTLRLAEPLTVRAVTSDQFGRLLTLRVRNQNNVIVNLPESLRKGDRLKLRVAYGGHLPPHQPDREALRLVPDTQPGPAFLLEPEPRFTYSNRAWWYPQTPITSFATARLRVTVPAGYSCVGTGTSEAPEEFEGPDGKARTAFVFLAREPLRYLSFVVSRIDLEAAETVSWTAPHAVQATAAEARPSTRVEIWTQRRQSSRADGLLATATDIVGLYQELMQDAPYPLLRVVALEDTLPGGHSPAYVAMVHLPVPGTPFNWSRDPVAFHTFPEFFLAHEIAHQYWGQAVGWKSYHEQWISEGFAQYFAVMYAERARPGDDFESVLRQMQRSSLEASSQGPVWLGYRLGHLKSDGRVFRAIVYNKGAMVLHMLRRLVGDDVFKKSLRRFYVASRFQRVGTDDLRDAFEAETGRSFELFFERWIYESDIPTIRTSWSVEAPQEISAGALGTASTLPILTVRLEQGEDRLFEVPVTVSITYADGREDRALARVEGAVTEVSLPVTGAVRDVRFNEDYAALVRIERARR